MLSEEPRTHRGSKSKHPEDVGATMQIQGVSTRIDMPDLRDARIDTRKYFLDN
jgi:hypothetical protein